MASKALGTKLAVVMSWTMARTSDCQHCIPRSKHDPSLMDLTQDLGNHLVYLHLGVPLRLKALIHHQNLRLSSTGPWTTRAQDLIFGLLFRLNVAKSENRRQWCFLTSYPPAVNPSFPRYWIFRLSFLLFNGRNK